MNQDYIYIGCFVDPALLRAAADQVTGAHLARIIEAPHVTFQYKPSAVDESLFGEEIDIIVLGYGNDGANEGFLVRLEARHPALAAWIKTIEVPHITISVSPTGKPVDTRYLTFRPLPAFHLTGIFGGYAQPGQVVTTPRS